MVDFDQIETVAWKKFIQSQGINLVIFLVLFFVMSFSNNLIVHPFLAAVGLTALSGYLQYCLTLAPNLRIHASLKSSGGSEYRNIVEQQLSEQGLSKMLNENWFVGERKRRMKSARDQSKNPS